MTEKHIIKVTNEQPSIKAMTDAIAQEAENLIGWAEEVDRTRREYTDAQRGMTASRDRLNEARKTLDAALGAL